MAKKLTAIFAAQDQLSSKLSSIEKQGQRTARTLQSVGTAVSSSFSKSPNIGNWTSAVGSYNKSAMEAIWTTEELVDMGYKTEDALTEPYDEGEKAVKDFMKTVKDAGVQVDDLGDSFEDAGDSVEDMVKDSKDAGSSIKDLDRRSGDLGKTIKTLGGIIVSAFAVNKIKEFAGESLTAYKEFESGFAEVSTLTPDVDDKQLESIKSEVKDFALDIGKTTDKVLPAMYNAISAGQTTKSVFKFMESANRLAVGGVAELNDSVAVLSTITNNYKDMGIDAATASDLLFTTVKKGVTTIPELSSALGEVVPSAAASKVAFSDVTAAMATLTASLGAGSTAKATTKLRGMFDELSTTGTEVDKTFRKITGDSFNNFIKKGGDLQQALAKLNDYAKSNNLSVKELFSSIEAGGAALILGSTSAKTFKENMLEMKDAAGATEAAYGRMTDTTQFKMDKLSAAWNGIKTDSGESLAEAISPLIEDMTANIGDYGEPITRFFSTLGKTIKLVAPLVPPLMNSLSSGLDGVVDVAEPMLLWMAENPDLVGDVLISIGTAIVTYKVVDGLMGVGAGIRAVGAAVTANPIGITVTVIATALVALGAACATMAKRAKEANLQKHFGSISLSAEELEKVASRIIRNGSIDKLRKSLEAFDEIEGIADSIDDAVESINSLNFKVSVGMKLTDEDKDSYIQSVDGFVKDSLDVISKQQYAMSLSLDVFAGSGSEGDSIRNRVNQFYLNNYENVSELGDKLKKSVNKAFEDGLLTVDEASVISNYMQQISKITEKISDAQFEAKLETLTMKYGGANLTPESFSQLQDELNEQVESAVADTDKSFEATISQYKIMLGEGEIDDETYQKWMKTAKEEYLENVGDIHLKANSFQTDTIYSAYKDEIGDLVPKLQEYIKTLDMKPEDIALGKFDINEIMEDFFLSSNIDVSPDTKNALSSLFEKVKPTEEGLQDLRDKWKTWGLQIPKEIEAGINEAILNTDALGMVSSNSGISDVSNSIMNLLNPKAFNSEQEQSFSRILTTQLSNSIGSVKTEAGVEELAGALQENVNRQLPPKVQKAMDNVVSIGKNYFESQMKKGVSVDMPVTINAKYKINGELPQIGSNGKIASHASGGIITKPTLSTFAEERPEAAIPIESTPNSINLWKETGRLLGVYKDEPSVPVLNSNGNESVRPASTSSEKTVTIRLEGIGSITVDAANAEQSEEKILDFLTSNIVPVLKSVLTQELYEEGNGSYEF